MRNATAIIVAFSGALALGGCAGPDVGGADALVSTSLDERLAAKTGAAGGAGDGGTPFDLKDAFRAFGRAAKPTSPALFSDAKPPADAAPAGSAEDLAKQLANPVASLISLPFQFNYDRGYGPDGDGERMLLNVQPVVPFALSANWNLILRTILPVVYQDDLFTGAGGQFGLGDTLQSFFFSPSKPTADGLIWAVGPALLYPTATDDLLGGERWAAGPTALVLWQKGPWTYGALANHLWSYAGDDDRADVNSTFLQPFISYTTKDAWTFALNTESTYDWEAEQWTVPINVVATKLLKIGGHPMQLGVGLRYWAESPDDGPEDFGVRVVMTYLFPKR